MSKVVSVTLYHPTKPQIDALEIINSDDAPMVTLLAYGRQVGKSFMMMMDAFSYCMNRSKAKVLWVSPILDQALKVQQQIEEYFEEYPEIFTQIVKKFDRKYNNIFFHNGSVMRFRSADSGDNLRGMTQDRIYIDEAAFTKESFIQEVLFPMVTRTNGRIIMASTFNGKNWYWDWYKRGLEEENRDSIRSIKRTYMDLDDAQVTKVVEANRKNMTKVQFSQEYLCEPVASHALFSGIDFAIQRTPINNPNKRLFIGMDIGISQDYTVLTCIDEDYNVVDIDRFHYRNSEMKYDEFKQRLINFVYKHYEWLQAGYFEMNNNELLFDELMADDKFSSKVESILVTPTSKPRIVDNLILLFEQRRITIPDEKNLIAELYDYGGKKTRTGIISYSNTYGKHDDMVMSLAHAAYCAFNEMDGGHTSWV